MKKLKYVVAKSGSFDQPFIFSDLIVHREFAQMAGFKPEQIVGAGFVQVDFQNQKFFPYGDSVSLKIGTTPEAIAAFEQMFNGYGF